MEKIIENNQAKLSGEITTAWQYSHAIYGESFFTATLSSKRESGVVDEILIMVSDRLVDVNENWIGQYVSISGQFRSYNKYEEGRNRLILSVFVSGIEITEGGFEDINSINIEGYICKAPTYRETPLGREIGDLLVAVNRPYGKSDYIPCICWGRNAKFAGCLDIGTCLRLHGRIQSREFKKKIGEEEFETRTAYEVSVHRLEVVEDNGGNVEM